MRKWCQSIMVVVRVANNGLRDEKCMRACVWWFNVQFGYTLLTNRGALRFYRAPLNSTNVKAIARNHYSMNLLHQQQQTYCNDVGGFIILQSTVQTRAAVSCFYLENCFFHSARATFSPQQSSCQSWAKIRQRATQQDDSAPENFLLKRSSHA